VGIGQSFFGRSLCLASRLVLGLGVGLLFLRHLHRFGQLGVVRSALRGGLCLRELLVGGIQGIGRFVGGLIGLVALLRRLRDLLGGLGLLVGRLLLRFIGGGLGGHGVGQRLVGRFLFSGHLIGRFVLGVELRFGCLDRFGRLLGVFFFGGLALVGFFQILLGQVDMPLREGHRALQFFHAIPG